MKRIFLTFSSDSFLSRAKVCVDSIKKYHPEDAVHLKHFSGLEVTSTYIPNLAKIRLLEAKIKLLQDYDEVIVIGADCVLYDRIDSFLEMPGTVLIPHVITPPSDPASFYKTGHVNADLMLFRQCSLPLLDWLISQDMKEETHNGSFYEQTLLSAASFFFDNISICKDPGINYAYFNFHERALGKAHCHENKYRINEFHLLKMVQFSGYVPGQPEKISKHYGETCTDPLILELFRDYESKIK